MPTNPRPGNNPGRPTGGGRSSTLILAAALLLLVMAVAGAAVATPAAATPVVDLSPYPWLYRRDPEATTAGPLVEVVVTGDVMLGRGVVGQADPLAAVAPWLRAADLALGNLEAVIVAAGQSSTEPASPNDPILLHAPPAAAGQLAAAGFDLLALANNHSLDQEAAGLDETIYRLAAAGLEGFGLSGAAGRPQPVLRRVNGLTLAFLAFTTIPPLEAGPAGPRPALWDPGRGTAAIAQARQSADAVIISVHWGYEYDRRPDPAQERIAEAMLAAGADIIFGHHPHVVQPVAVFQPAAPGGRAQLLAYSLGNFVFDQAGPDTSQGLALRLFFDKTGLQAAQALPIQAGPQPRLMPLEEAAALLNRITPPPDRLVLDCASEECRPLGAPAPESARPSEAIFWSGAIDLTGDGRDEVIRRAGERVTIYEAGQAVWHSPPEWRVVDLALGDPNDDGRFEMLLAIYQVDAAGYERSQPYIVGYRGGRYRLMWGGRPVNAPILEVAVADLDGDLSQEIITLEQQPGGRTIAVWRWAGWSFSLLWRSRPGSFANLTAVPRADGLSELIIVTSGN
jgi:poly-gamma-glutamate capsule biosynthesis protein CapA/YwtB (metallophosphatase superfamily)